MNIAFITMILNKKPKNFTINALFNTMLTLTLALLLCSTANAKHLLIYGDSLSAAYGMDEDKGWVALLARSLESSHNVSNASISGETSSGGLARLPLTLQELSPDVVFLELGANDGLRGQSTALLKQNLSEMIKFVKASGATLVLAGISLPPTYGPRYIDQFRAVYADLAKEHEIPLLDLYQPQFLETPGYIQDDGLHPAEITQPIVRDLVLDFLNQHNLLEQ